MIINSNQGTVIVTEVEKKRERLPGTVEVLETDLANTVFDSMMDKMKIASLEDLSAQLTFEIMTLKMGGI